MCRFWWAWKGDTPLSKAVDFMNKNYPSDWTYAEFATQFRAEFYGNEMYQFSDRTFIKLL